MSRCIGCRTKVECIVELSRILIKYDEKVKLLERLLKNCKPSMS